jgi:hypothetical protein
LTKMAKTNHLKLPVADEFSTDRVRDHVLLMQRFQCILNGIKHPVRDADRFPDPPNGIKSREHELTGIWRVQCFLMSAEVRYSMYLRFLRGWVLNNQERAEDKQGWPLPPW